MHGHATVLIMTVAVGFRLLFALCIFALFVFCGVWWQLDDKELMQSYTTDAAKQNKAMSSRLCGADRHAAVLYGVFSTAEKGPWRSATRQQVQCHLNTNVHNTVFVVGAPRTEREHTILKREAAMHGDIFTLSCTENMNSGKSYTYFKEALEQFPCFDFYAKVDDDTAWIPDRLSSFIQAAPRENPIMIGRHEPFTTNKHPFLYWRLFWEDGLRDVAWTRDINDYCAGMLYILNAAAVKSWVALNPIQLHGDEDMRTFYYMKIIRAEVVSTHSAFHDHMRSTQGVTEWCEPITNASMAVHKCKAIDLLVETFASLCRHETPTAHILKEI